MLSRSAVLAALFTLGLSTVGFSQQGEPGWPTYRGNNGRTGYTAEQLPKGLRLRWTHDAAPPAPAWPAPARGSLWQRLENIEPRVVDDRAIHPVVASGCVLFGSSRQDEVVCLDSRSGQVRWRVVCDGPVRYAPTVVGQQVFVGSDDGVVRCLSIRDGAEIWRETIGPNAPKIPGNGRLISPYPVRTSVLVEGGIAYACAGLFPMQGVYAAALDCKTGKSVWHRQLPTQSPQGYLLATEKLLIAPHGRANPFSLHLDSGKSGPSFGGVGGTFAVIADEHLVAGRGNDDTLFSSTASSARKFVSFSGRELVVTPKISILLRKTEVLALDRPRLNALRREQQNLAPRLKKKPRDKKAVARAAAIKVEIEECVLWRIAHVNDVSSAIVADDTVCLGRDGGVEFRSVKKGTVTAKAKAAGRIVSMAVAEGQLITTTATGKILCYGKGAPAKRNVKVAKQGVLVTAAARAEIRPWLEPLDSPRGYALIVQPAALGGVGALLARSELHVVVTHSDQRKVDQFRAELRAAGSYGSRAVVHHVAHGAALPLVEGFANLVVDLSGNGWPFADLRLLAAPGRGAVVREAKVWRRPKIEGAGSWTHQYANPGNTAASEDQLVNRQLTLQWFGGPGPRRMIDRHMRGPPPLAINGRMFIVAENGLIGVDAFNGTELWDLELPDSQRYAMPYDAGYIACCPDHVLAAVNAKLWVIDPATGKVRRRVPVPKSRGAKQHWGFVGISGGRIYGSTMLATAPRTKPGRKEVDAAYRSGRPVVTSRSLLCMDPKSWTRRWNVKRGAIVNPTITLGDDKIFFVESRNKASKDHATGRIPLATLLGSDAWLVALHARTGKKAWEIPLVLPECRNVLYLAATGDRLVLLGSRDDPRRDAHYHLRVMSTDDGKEIWRAGHGNAKPGQLSHGEQVHHPVVLQGLIVAEPFVYRLADGTRVNPDGGNKAWSIKRPGHSCGTMSGAGSCLFFRANNPTLLDLSEDRRGDRFVKLAPSRAGCWINIIPACGLVLIPEGSASCVCHYPLQTSMAFRPRKR